MTMTHENTPDETAADLVASAESPTAAFLKAAQSLHEVELAFRRGALSPYEHKLAREGHMADAITALAASHGVRLQTPLLVDSNGEFRIVALDPSGRPPSLGCGAFGDDFARLLNQHKIRTGIQTGAVLCAENGWCLMNHFEAEKMVLQNLGAELARHAAAPPAAELAIAADTERNDSVDRDRG